VSQKVETQNLFAEYFSGEISEGRLHKLEQALSQDADLRRQFIEHANVDSALSDLAALSMAELAEFDSLEFSIFPSHQHHSSANSSSRALGTVLGAVAVLILFSLFIWTPESIDEPVAELMASVDSNLITEQNVAWTENELRAGQYALKRGLLQLRFQGGVMVYLEAPARFEVVNGQRVILQEGRLSASVPPEGVGFTVETPEAEVIDFGTEFSIDVGGDSSEVHVFDGLVRVEPRSKNNEPASSIDLRTSQAVRIDQSKAAPFEIELDIDRFVRDFKEPTERYPGKVMKLKPVAYYRMPIRDQGLASFPAKYRGEVLTDENLGTRPPHARGFIGGSLRIQAGSIGKGGHTHEPLPLTSGAFTAIGFVYAEGSCEGAAIIRNATPEGGNFSLRVSEEGHVEAEVRTRDGKTVKCTSDVPFPHETWKQIIVTADGKYLRLFEDAKLVGETACGPLLSSDDAILWFGTESDGAGLWSGRIDEVAIYDRALLAEEIDALYEDVIYVMSIKPPYYK